MSDKKKEDKKEPEVTLKDPKETYALPLKEKEKLSHDALRLRYSLPSDQHRLGLPVGHYIFLTAEIHGEKVTRCYSPVSSDEDLGFVDLVIKCNFDHPKFPCGDKMSRHLEGMKEGETTLFSGPGGHITYKGDGAFEITEKDSVEVDKRQVKRIGMIAGGSGLTPNLQVIRAVLRKKDDPTELWLIFANQTEHDILLREELEKCAEDKRFHLWFTLDRPPEEGWKFSKGFIDYDMLKDHMPPAEDSLILMCGPGPMINYACKPNLEKLGFKPNQMMTF